MGIPFILDEKGIAELRRIKEYAESHPIKPATLKGMAEGRLTTVGDHDEFTCHLPIGFKVVYSIEMQPPGKCHHLSVSVQSESGDRLPSEHMVQMVMTELGFKRELRKCIRVWISDDPVSHINVLDLCD